MSPLDEVKEDTKAYFHRCTKDLTLKEQFEVAQMAIRFSEFLGLETAKLKSKGWATEKINAVTSCAAAVFLKSLMSAVERAK